MIVCTECRRAQPMRCTMCVAVKTAPAWLDAPDGEGWWWLREEMFWTDGAGKKIVMTHVVLVESLAGARPGDFYVAAVWTGILKGQWQRVAPPREA